MENDPLKDVDLDHLKQQMEHGEFSPFHEEAWGMSCDEFAAKHGLPVTLWPDEQGSYFCVTVNAVHYLWFRRNGAHDGWTTEIRLP